MDVNGKIHTINIFYYKQHMHLFVVDGGWSEWSEFGFCRAPRCDTGFRIRTRVCNNPRPQHGGAHCQGNQYEREECFNEQECPRKFDLCPWTLAPVHTSTNLQNLCLQSPRYVTLLWYHVLVTLSSRHPYHGP